MNGFIKMGYTISAIAECYKEYDYQLAGYFYQELIEIFKKYNLKEKALFYSRLFTSHTQKLSSII